MEEDMQDVAKTTTIQAFEQYRMEREIANHIKKTFDSQFTPVWNCVVGRNFGCHVTHETKRYIHMSYAKNVSVLLWKSN